MEVTLEQQRAVAMANARRRAAEADAIPQETGWLGLPKGKPTLAPELARQAGLTARYGLQGLSGLAGIFSDPLAATANLALPKRFELPRLRDATVNVLDRVGLPKPGSATERVIGDMSEAMVGVGGLSQAAQRIAPMVSGLPKHVMDVLARNQGAQQISAAGAGFGGGTARESNVGPLGQLGFGLLGSIAAPASIGLGKWAGGHLADAGAAVGASFGNQRALNRLASHAAKRIAADSREQILRDIGNVTEYVPGSKPTVAEAIVQGQIGKGGQYGGATVKLQKDLTGAKGIEDILTGTARTQKVAVADSLKDLNARMTPVREKILADVNRRGGVDPDKILAQIDDMLAKTDISEFSTTALTNVRASIVAKIGKHGVPGKINADAIYSTRKELGNTIAKVSKDTQTWDKKVTGKLESDIQKIIDQSILDVKGGSGWRKDYMDVYSAGRKAASDVLARQREVKILAASVKGTNVGDLTAGELPKLPTLLSRPMMAVNFGLKLIARDANTPVAREMAIRMQNPQEYAKLLALKPTDPLRIQAEQMVRTAAIVGAQQQNQRP